MTNRRYYKINNLAECVLYKLYDIHVSNDDIVKCSVEDIQKTFKTRVAGNLIRSALEMLRRERFILRTTSQLGYVYAISEPGMIKVQDDLQQPNCLIAYYASQGDAVFEEVAGISSNFMTLAERRASIDWAPLALERDTEEFTDAVAKLESAIKTIEGDNGFAVEHPKQRDGILASLKDGLVWLKDKSPSKETLRGLILAPLRWIATKFAETSIGEAAKIAVAAMLKLLTGS